MKNLFFVAALTALPALAQSPAQPLDDFYRPLDAASPRRLTYTIQPGETLFTIAERLFGDAYQARLIQQVNQLDDPLRPPVGRAIQIPVPALGLLYTFQKADGCDLWEVTESHLFRAGDRFRLRLTTNIDGHLYVFNRRSSGQMVRLHAGSRGQKVRAFADYSIPQADAQDEWFRLDAEGGGEEILVLVSTRPLTELDSDLAATDAQRRLDSLLRAAQSRGSAVSASANGHGRSLVLASPVDNALVLAHRIILRKQ